MRTRTKVGVSLAVVLLAVGGYLLYVRVTEPHGFKTEKTTGRSASTVREYFETRSESLTLVDLGVRVTTRPGKRLLVSAEPSDGVSQQSFCVYEGRRSITLMATAACA